VRIREIRLIRDNPRFRGLQGFIHKKITIMEAKKTKMSNQSSTSNDKQLTIQDIIHQIEQKSKGGGYIYRGERKLNEAPPYNGRVSSNLWREYGIEDEKFDIERVQKELLAAAKKHTGTSPRTFVWMSWHHQT